MVYVHAVREGGHNMKVKTDVGVITDLTTTVHDIIEKVWASKHNVVDRPSMKFNIVKGELLERVKTSAKVVGLDMTMFYADGDYTWYITADDNSKMIFVYTDKDATIADSVIGELIRAVRYNTIYMGNLIVGENLEKAFFQVIARNIVFSGVRQLQPVNLEKMFALTVLDELDLTWLDTSKVENMSNMFAGAIIDNLDIDNFEYGSMLSAEKHCNIASLFESSIIHNLKAKHIGSRHTGDAVKAFKNSQIREHNIEYITINAVREPGRKPSKKMYRMFCNAKIDVTDKHKVLFNFVDYSKGMFTEAFNMFSGAHTISVQRQIRKWKGIKKAENIILAKCPKCFGRIENGICTCCNATIWEGAKQNGNGEDLLVSAYNKGR